MDNAALAQARPIENSRLLLLTAVAIAISSSAITPIPLPSLARQVCTATFDGSSVPIIEISSRLSMHFCGVSE
ncbi:hypothetical protein [Sinorhizobium americanum]|uniref:hypothetical protein n=1 Tax=Sinorhizobium americanum TaxID=194963 RepID=UPI001F3457ED|nr:hypothetical protein [Sinorhizobium americanum]